MTRWGVAALVCVALVAGLALRLARLDARPMHHDEANQAVKFGTLLERGEYRYDAHDHHGPTLYYLALPAAKLRGQATLASLDEGTLRGVTAAFGAATILLLALLSAAIGRTAVAAGALLLALSPAMVFYSRMFIQESLFACFTLAFVVAVGRIATGGGMAWSTLAGLSAGLAVATKETSAIVLPATLVAGVVAWWSLGPARQSVRLARQWRLAAVAGLAVAAGVAGLFFSSFLTNPAALLEPFRAVGTYLDRGIAPASHGAPVALLPRPARLLLVWRVAVERGAGARARGDRFDGRGCASGPHAPGTRLLAALPGRRGADHRGGLLRHPLQDALEPAPLLRHGVRAGGRRVVETARLDHVQGDPRHRGRRVRCRGDAPGLAGLAGVGHLRRRPEEPLRLRPDRARRRADGRSHPGSRGAASRW